MIGTGIFLKPSEMAAVGGSVSVVYAAWIVGGVLTLFGALSFAELGAAMPEAGGQYAYLTRGLGPVWGFLFGWTHSTVGESSSAASIAAGFARFSAFLIPAIGTPIFIWHITPPFAHKPYEFVFSWAQPAAVAAIILFTFINYLGVRLGGQVQVALTFLKIAAVLSIVAAGFWLGHGSRAHFHPFWPAHAGAGTLTSFLAALAAALWVYDGWENLNRVGSEIQNPQRNFPMALSALGTLNSSVLSGARVPYAMGRDGLFFRVTAIVHPKFRTPSGALVFQGTLASVMALTGTFEELTSLYIFAAWIFYALSVVAMFRLRRTEPDMPRAFRTWGYPIVPGLFVVSALALTVNIWLERPVRSSIGLLLILSGLFFYRHWRAKAAPDSKPA